MAFLLFLHRPVLVCIAFALSLSTPARCFAGETRNLAQVCADYGVSETTNTMLHATERNAKGFGSLFFLARSDAAQTQAMDNLWKSLAKTQFVEVRTEEPKEPCIFIVLNTGTSSKDRPVEEIWVDSEGLLHFLADHNKRPREFMVFKGPEAASWARDTMNTRGRPLK
jgi:hypothetical protein